MKLTEVLKQPGGIDKLNREVIFMFDHFTTNQGMRIGELAYVGHTTEKTMLPVLHSISRGSGVYLHHDATGAADYISVPSGTHFDTRRYHIYHPARGNKPADTSSLVHVVSNIYSTKPAK